MALIKCSNCGKEISDKATSCIHCGNPINLTNDKNTNTEDYNSNIIGKKNVEKILIASTFIIPIIEYVIRQISNSLTVSWLYDGLENIFGYPLSSMIFHFGYYYTFPVFITMCIYNVFLHKYFKAKIKKSSIILTLLLFLIVMFFCIMILGSTSEYTFSFSMFITIVLYNQFLYKKILKVKE